MQLRVFDLAMATCVFLIGTAATAAAANTLKECSWSVSPRQAKAILAKQLVVHGFHQKRCNYGRGAKTHRQRGRNAIKSPKAIACFVSDNNMHADFWIGNAKSRLGLIFRTGGLINYRRDRVAMSKAAIAIFAVSSIQRTMATTAAQIRDRGVPKKRKKKTPAANRFDSANYADHLSKPGAQGVRRITISHEVSFGQRGDICRDPFACLISGQPCDPRRSSPIRCDVLQ